MEQRRRNEFPPTRATWLGGKLRGDAADIAEANRYLMEVYDRPLRVYFLGSSFRRLGEPEEIINGFFADRLSRERFLVDWLGTERPLRYWLIVAFKHFLLERARALGRQGRERLLEDTTSEPDHESGPEEAFHRSAAISMVDEALKRAASICEESGLSEHWRIFLRHYLDGRNYESLRQEFDVDPRRAAVMARTASNKFKTALRDVVAQSCADESDVDAEIGALLEIIS